jgi:hypothetical protein
LVLPFRPSGGGGERRKSSLSVKHFVGHHQPSPAQNRTSRGPSRAPQPWASWTDPHAAQRSSPAMADDPSATAAGSGGDAGRDEVVRAEVSAATPPRCVVIKSSRVTEKRTPPPFRAGSIYPYERFGSRGVSPRFLRASLVLVPGSESGEVSIYSNGVGVASCASSSGL